LSPQHNTPLIALSSEQPCALPKASCSIEAELCMLGDSALAPAALRAPARMPVAAAGVSLLLQPAGLTTAQMDAAHIPRELRK
jgi:hypothetical protein